MIPEAPKPRQGPRPLATHLAAASLTWQGSRLALPFLKSGSLDWKPELRGRAAALVSDLAAVPFPEFSEAVERELTRQAGGLVDGIGEYRRHQFHRPASRATMVWRRGTTSLLDFGPDGGRPVFVVPSLINRGYVLDLIPERSFIASLRGRGYRPLLIDWDAPGEIERRFTLTDYVAGRLDEALEEAVGIAEAPVPLIGYCMGGLLATALATRRRSQVAGLVVLATPWSFRAVDRSRADFMAALAGPVATLFAAAGQVPTDFLQSLFALFEPLLTLRKFARFADLDAAAPSARDFVATEDWLNDGVPMALPVATETFAEWYGSDATARGLWRIAGRPVTPGDYDRPALVVVAAEDRLVPPASAIALADALPRSQTLTVPFGHVGLMVSPRAPDRVWRPVADWLDRLTSARRNESGPSRLRV